VKKKEISLQLQPGPDSRVGNTDLGPMTFGKGGQAFLSARERKADNAKSSSGLKSYEERTEG